MSAIKCKVYVTGTGWVAGVAYDAAPLSPELTAAGWRIVDVMECDAVADALASLKELVDRRESAGGPARASGSDGRYDRARAALKKAGA